VACFRNIAAHQEPGGCFVIEVMIPDLQRLPARQNVVPLHVSPTRWAFDVYDIATQTMSSSYVEVTGPWRVHLDSFPVRVAGRTFDGPARRAATARAVGRVDTGTLHEREPPACLDRGEAHQLYEYNVFNADELEKLGNVEGSFRVKIGGSLLVGRPSALPSISGVLLPCYEPPRWANCSHRRRREAAFVHHLLTRRCILSWETQGTA
jgi:hypothetical protein